MIKFIILPFLFVLSTGIFCLMSIEKKVPQAVNALIGDISYQTKFGEKPHEGTDEHLRIKTHLEYVARILRQKDVSNLPASLQKERARLINLLHIYSENGVFPKNFDYPNQRKPCFIDKEGNICAVGYLIAQTAGRQVAESINQKYQYEAILDMHEPQIDSWIAQSGLTKQECAMIQPQYYWQQPTTNNKISTGFGLATAFTSGLNVSLAVLNASQIRSENKSKLMPILGLIAGVGQMTLGTVRFMNEQSFNNRHNYKIPNESNKALALINIGIGTSTSILSIFNLANTRRPKEKKVTWNLYGIPTQDKQFCVALNLSKKF